MASGLVLARYRSERSSAWGVPDRAVPPFPDEPTRREVSDPTLAHAVYGLYALGGILPILPLVAAIVGVMIAYVRKESADPDLASHYEWQIRTFWWGSPSSCSASSPRPC